MAKVYIQRTDGGEDGPVDLSRLRRMVKRGEIDSSVLVKENFVEGWIPLGEKLNGQRWMPWALVGLLGVFALCGAVVSQNRPAERALSESEKVEQERMLERHRAAREQAERELLVEKYKREGR
jgi:hypothetical protein